MVELLVAMAAGLAVGAAAMLLSKNAVNFFQHEARISGTQLGVTLGMTRLTQDLQRAALLSSPNIQRDLQNNVVCGDSSVYPVGLQQLAGIQILQGGSAAQAPQSVDNKLNPDAIVIGGSLSTTEQFAVRTIDGAAGGTVVVRLENDDAMRRTRARYLAGAGESIPALFAVGRFARIVDQLYKHHYGAIESVTEGPATDPYVDVTLAATPPVAIGGPCGLHGHETGALLSVVYRVRYELASIASDPNYGVLAVADPATATLTGDARRSELIRSELGADGAALPASGASPPELVTEYAVDLKFGLQTAVWDGATKTYTSARYPIAVPEDPIIYTIAGDVFVGGASPETIRAVQVRLATRTRAPDRASALDIDLGKAPDGRLARFLLTDVTGSQAYARTRTLYSDVFLPNQAGVQ
jgi:hypothetical protein